MKKTYNVDATFNDKRKRVVSSSTVGKATKSLKVLILIAVKRTMIDKAILKVKRTSNKTAGKGTSIMTKTSKTRMGIAPWADGLGSFAVSIPNIFIKYRY